MESGPGMTNADLFKAIFGLYATEVWAKPEQDFLDWLNSPVRPPTQPERIKGHWIAITSWNNTYKCSVCGRLLVNITDGKNKVAKNYPYCHCGADMRGE